MRGAPPLLSWSFIVNVTPAGSNSTPVPPNFGDAQIAAAPQTAGAPLAAGPGARDGLTGRPQTPFAIPSFEPATKGLLDSAAGRGSGGPQFRAPVASDASTPSFPTVGQQDTAASPGFPAPGPTGTGPRAPDPIAPNPVVDAARAINDYSKLVGSLKGIVDPNTLKLAKQVGAGASLISTLGAGKFTGGSVTSSLGALATLTGSPVLATVAQGADVVNKGFKIAEGLQTGSLGGFSAVGDIAGVASSVASLVGAPREYGQIFNGISAVSGLFGGSSAASALLPGLGPVGAVISAVTFLIDVLSVPVEHFSQEKPFAQNLSLSGRGAIDPKTGQPAANDEVTTARSNTDRNRYWYNYKIAAKDAPIKDLNFSLTPETAPQPAPNAPYSIVSLTGPNSQRNYGGPGYQEVPVDSVERASSIVVRRSDGSTATLIADVGDADFSQLSATRNSIGEPSFTTWTDFATGASLTKKDLTPAIQVPTGNFKLHLDVNFAAINPVTKDMRMAQDVVVSAADAAKIRAAFGADSATVGGADARIEALRPQINTFTSVAPPRSDGPGGRTSGPYAPGTIEYRTTEQNQKDAGRPKLYTYANYNPGQDNAPDLVERTLGDPNDKSIKVTLGSSVTPLSADNGWRGQYSFTANADEAPEIGPLLPLLLQYTASHPELHELYKGPKGERANESASGDITLVYRHLRDTGVLPKLKQLTALAGAPRGKTQREQLADIASRGPQIAALKKELGLTVDPAFLASAPSVAAASNGQTLRILEDYISGATPKALAINANDWTDAQALDYLAANPELIDTEIGTDLAAARNHWNDAGRIEGRAVSNANADTYLAAHPEVKAVADVSLAQPTIASIIGADDKIDSTGTVDDKDRSVTLALPNGEGRARLAAQRASGDNAAPSLFTGTSSQGQRITASAVELNALPKSAAPSAQAVHEFAVQAFIDSRVAAPPAPAQWSEQESFDYLANNTDLIKPIGANAEAAFAHYKANGRFEGRPVSGDFDADGFLARRPDVRRAAIAALAKPTITAVSNASITLALPNGGGSVELMRKPAAAGEAAAAAAFTGTSSKGAAVTMTAAELSALTTRPTQDDVRAFATKQ
jgi:hypothetical protein